MNNSKYAEEYSVTVNSAAGLPDVTLPLGDHPSDLILFKVNHLAYKLDVDWRQAWGDDPQEIIVAGVEHMPPRTTKNLGHFLSWVSAATTVTFTTQMSGERLVSYTVGWPANTSVPSSGYYNALGVGGTSTSSAAFVVILVRDVALAGCSDLISQALVLQGAYPVRRGETPFSITAGGQHVLTVWVADSGTSAVVMPQSGYSRYTRLETVTTNTFSFGIFDNLIVKGFLSEKSLDNCSGIISYTSRIEARPKVPSISAAIRAMKEQEALMEP